MSQTPHLLIGVPAETAAGETRVAATPETVKKLVAQGHSVRVQSGAGVAASVTDEAYAAAGAAEMVVYEWLGDADHPDFREVLQLVK
mgnify:CR=1 FL=1